MQQILRLRDTSRPAAATPSAQYELRYRPLSEIGCGFAFPCDVCGQVVMDELSERSLVPAGDARLGEISLLEWLGQPTPQQR